ncbi:MAG: hypothetical protein K8E24_015215 [Methanobacterium paludis]|nr:hypothetical protein [Methanobacterium paludis]
MVKIKIPREKIIYKGWGEFIVNVIEDKILDHGRWSIYHELIFELDGKLYKTSYSEGATECQDESPFELDHDGVDCVEVKPVEKTIIVYEEV